VGAKKTPLLGTRNEEYLAWSILFALFVVGVLFLCSDGGCSSSQALESAHARGAAAGYADGERRGKEDGYRQGLEEATSAAYVETLSTLSTSRDVRLSTFYCLVGVFVGLSTGFALQYVTFYSLRRLGFLGDIDAIVLSPETLDNLSNASPAEPHVVMTEEPMNLLSPDRDG
jgi:hypothetical protein